MYKRIAKWIELLTNGLYKVLKLFLSEQFLTNWKPIHLCWWFNSHNLEIPKYFIGANSAPTVTTTSPATNIMATTTTCSGNITATGGVNPTARGICYSSSNSTPTISDSKVTESGSYGTGAFSESLTGLSPNTLYYFRAYATNTVDTGYGAIYSFTTKAIADKTLLGKSNIINPPPNNKDLFSETFELNNLNRWTISNDGTSTTTTSNDYAKDGNYSCRIEYKQASAYSLIRQTLSVAKTELYVKFWLYLPSGYTQPDTSLSLFDIKDSSWNMQFETFLNVSGTNLVISYTRTGGDATNVVTSIVIPKGIWTCLEFHVVKSATVGAVDIFLNGDSGYSATSLNTGTGDLDMIEFGSGWTTSAMTGSPLYYDNIEISENRIGTTILKGALAFTFDDGMSGVYTYARDIFKNAGLKATSFIITDWTGGTGYMTSTQIQALYSDGWEIGSHTVDHTDLTTLNDTDLTNELANSKTYLEGLGFTVYSLASPGGAYNNTVLAKIAKYYINHRTANDTKDEYLPTNNYLLGIRGIYGTTTPTVVEGWIDATIASGQKLILCLHDVVASSPTTYEIASADLQTIVSYLSGKQIDVLTMKDLVNSVGT